MTRELDLEMCPRTGKIVYRTRGKANAALASVSRQGKFKHGHKLSRRESTRRTAYRCNHCGGWHLTSITHYYGVTQDKLPPISQRRGKR